MAGYLDESFLGSGSKAVVVYAPRKKRTYRASVGGSVPAVIDTTARTVKTRKPRKSRPYKATVETPTPTETPRPEFKSTVDISDAAFREKALSVGKLNEARRAKERRYQESQLQKQMRAEAALAKRKARARAKSVRKHKRIARKIWHRLI